MPDWKLLGLYAAWLLASGAIAVVFGGFLGFTASGLGFGESAARTVFTIVTVGSFVVLAALPFLLRRRTADSAHGDQG